MRYSVITLPAAEALTVADVKTFALRETSTTFDAWIADLIKAARQEFEQFTNRLLLSTVCDLYLGEFPDCGKMVKLPAPLTAVGSIKYKDTAGVLQTLASSGYVVDTISEPGEITLASGQSWPGTYEEANAVTIRFTSGWANAAAVDAQVKEGMYLYIRQQFDGVDRLAGYESLWWPYRTLSL